MVRSPMKSEIDHGLKKGPWTQEEDEKLKDYIEKHGHGSWQSLPRRAGLNRCGKSCRLRWSNYLRPDIKRGNFSPQEVQTIIDLHSTLGNKWAMIATRLPGRTDNEIKNYWNTHLRKKLLRAGIDPQTHQLITDFNFLQNLNNFPMSSLQNMANFQLLENIVRLLSSNPLPSPFLAGLNTLNSNPSLQLPSPPSNVEYGAFSGDYKPVSDTFRPPEIREFCLPGLTPSGEAGNGSVCDYSAANQDYGELLVGDDDEEGGNSFWKDILYESFPSFSM